jgi:hypothetical protein
MKPNTYLILIIIFISISIWLSFTIKKANTEITHKNRQLHQSEEENQKLLYQQTLMKEAFNLNLVNEPVVIDHKINLLQKDAKIEQILYLKANACSPCSMGVIKSILKKNAESGLFSVVSHNSNQYFLEQAIKEAEIAEDRVTWLNDKLYPDVRAEYDAEMLFVNSKGFIVGRLPLALLKEEGMFEILTKN